MRDVFREVVGVELGEFPRMTHAEAMRRYGSDKPDLRIALELVDVHEQVADSEFKVFTDWAGVDGGRVCALRIPGGAALSRKQIDEYAAHAAKFGAKGLAYAKLSESGELSSPIAKFFADDAFATLLAHVGAANGDLVFFGAGPYATVSDFMGAVRLKAGKEFGLVEAGWKPLWITDFPMFEWDEEEGRYVALHHPFTAPAVDDVDALRANARTAVSRGYDMVLNGNEIGGGSIRIHDSRMQSAVFELLGIGADEAQAKFGFLLDALKYGAPPHGGIAFGVDRIAALMAGSESIRDVIAFPKTTTAQCLMTGAPSEVPDAQLAEVHVAVRPKADG
jgi:aspartyl-tRNA synthetase